MKHALAKAVGRQVHLTVDVHNKLDAWRDLFSSLAKRTTHLRELDISPPTWIGTTGASGSGMGGVCQDIEGQYFVWISPFSTVTQSCLVSSSNPTGDGKIKDLELGALPM